MLDIYKASAGSGKTFALTLEYFRIIFESPVEYKNILAVTFTNKATEEMKSRIMNELHRLAEGEKSDYGKLLKQDLKLNDEQLKNKASLLRTMLLHDYGRLSITTIDRFFQRIIKAFTRELGIFPGYNVELDSDFVLIKAVDKVMQQIKEYPELRNWISELMNSSVEEGKSWSVKNKIADLGAELFRENYMLFDKHILEKFEDKHFLKNYQHFLNTIIQEFEQKLTNIADRALQTIQNVSLELGDFKGGKAGCASWFYKLKAGNFSEPTMTIRKGAEDPDTWVTKNAVNKGKIEDICPELMRYLQEALDIFDGRYKYYLSATQLSGNLYQLGILNDLYREVRAYCNEKGLMLLSDTTHILNLLIANNDTSFLFEKCGNYYKHLMIDEFQDTSAMQWKNFRPLVVNSLGEGAKVMIVGDVKQSIYRWRNGDWRLLANGVEDQFRNLGVNNIFLKDNWRSAQEIVAFNNDFFETAACTLNRLYINDTGEEDERAKTILQAYQGLRQTSRQQRTGYVDITFGPEKKEEGGEQMIMTDVVAIILDILKRGGKLSDIVILVRGGKEGAFVADYLIQNSIWWIEYADLDGIRQDTYVYPDPDMMVRWCKEVFEEYPNFNIVGEVMVPNNPVGTAYWQQNSIVNGKANTRLKSVMDFRLRTIAADVFHEETSWNTGLQLLFEHFAYDFCYPDINNVMRLLENHDTDRFLLEDPENLNAYKQAVTMLLTIPGIPQLYYGQELLMTGSTKEDFGYVRPDMPGGWNGDEISVFQESGRTAMQQEAFNFMKKMLHWRKGNDAISKGKMKHFMPRSNVYVYERSYNGKSILVIMNGVNKEVDLDLTFYKEVIGDRTNSKNVLTDSNVPLGKKLHLQPKEVLVLEL